MAEEELIEHAEHGPAKPEVQIHVREEFDRFTEEYVGLLKRYWRPDAKMPADARPVAVLFYAFPWPGE